MRASFGPLLARTKPSCRAFASGLLQEEARRAGHDRPIHAAWPSTSTCHGHIRASSRQHRLPAAVRCTARDYQDSLNEIGEAFGGRDHGTVLHACKLVKKRMKEQDKIRQTISFIDSALQR